MTGLCLQLIETKNFYLKHFFLNLIFTPLEGGIIPQWGKSMRKRKSTHEHKILIEHRFQAYSHSFMLIKTQSKQI